MLDMLVAHAAPAMPRPRVNIMIGSRNMFTTTPSRTETMTFFAAPSALRMLVSIPELMRMDAHVLSGNMYSLACSWTFSAPMI